MKPWRCACLASMSHAGAAAEKKTAKSAWSATIGQTSLPITPRIAPFSNNSVSSWSCTPQLMAAMQHLVLGRVRPPHPHLLLLHQLPLFLLTGVQLACLGCSQRLQKQIATTPARSLITRASMKDLCTTVNIRLTFLFTLIPPMPLLNLLTPPPGSRPTAATPHHPSIRKASNTTQARHCSPSESPGPLHRACPWHGSQSPHCQHWGNGPHVPDKRAFISYRPVSGHWVRMGNNSFAPILGSGSAVIAILIGECLHVPTIRNPLYSLHAHQQQHECGFIGMQGLRMYVFFPSFIVEVDTATDCHLSYAPIGRATKMSSLDYVQPIQARNSASATASTLPPAPAVIEADNHDIPPEAVPIYVSHWPKKPPAPPAPPIVLPFIPPPASSIRLKDLTHEELIQRLYSVEHVQCLPNTSNVMTMVMTSQPNAAPQLNWNACPTRRLLPPSTTQTLASCWSNLVTGIMLWRPREHIHQRNSIDSPAVTAFATISILFPA